jgi:hypothetical protein
LIVVHTGPETPHQRAAFLYLAITSELADKPVKGWND